MSSSSTTKICFNTECREPRPDSLVKAWKLRAGGFAELCDLCASAYKEERFCELFHLNAAGWRSCETCRKPLHCGCVVSMHAFILLDAGGVECNACNDKKSITGSNKSRAPLPLSERFQDISRKNWNPVAVPNGGQWWHSTNARKIVTSQSDLYSRIPYEVDRSNAMNKLISAERPSVSGFERVLEDPSERAVPSSLDISVFDRLSGKNVSTDMVVALNALNRSGNGRKRGVSEPGSNISVTGMSFDGHQNSSANYTLQSASAKEPVPHGMVVPYPPSNEVNVSKSLSGTQPQRQMLPPPLSKQLPADSQNGLDSSAETQTANGRARGDTRGRNQLLPRYWPKITDQELQQISGDSNSLVTPLFEKILSASDAGRIGRLVLPKKCAEAYFPSISQPEGVPLRVQDSKGQEWVFQFRFWPNNNSRMYVLEGVTPCIQNMQLQAGDTVTFSRLDPDGKLVMGFRKTSSSPSPNQDNRKPKIGNGVSKHAEVNMKEANTWSEVDKSGYIAKEAYRPKSCIAPGKRKNSVLGVKSKRFQIENEDLVELQLTWEEAQGLLRPPPSHVPIILVVDGQVFEEYEEPPILGKPTIFTTNDFGESIQWAQCEDCSKWRKLPVDALLPPKWTCSDNSWNLKRSSCSADQEITDEQLQDLLNSSNNAVSKKKNKDNKDSDAVEGSEGLDTLANLAILEEAEDSPSAAQPPTTKHPRHRPGCTCIVCIQPPSGKGPKHSETCICNVCLTVKRRFRTLMERRGKRPPENELGTIRKKQQKLDKPEQVDDPPTNSNANSELNQELVPEIACDDYNHKNPSSPFKGGIDLNIQPEREDETSPASGSGSIVRFFRDPLEVHDNQQKSTTSFKNRGLDPLDTDGGGSEVGGDNLGNDKSHNNDYEDGNMNNRVDPSI